MMAVAAGDYGTWKGRWPEDGGYEGKGGGEGASFIKATKIMSLI